MGISVESSFFRCWSPSLHSETKRQSWWWSCFPDWEALWGRMTRQKSLESQVVNLVTVQLNAWDRVFLVLVCCHVSQLSLSHRLWMACSCRDDSPWVPSVSRSDPVLTCNCACTIVEATHRPGKKAVDAYSWHMTVWFNSFDANGPGHRHRGCVIN